MKALIRAHYYNSSYRLSNHTYTATASPTVTSNDISVCDIGIYVLADGYYYSSTNTSFNAKAHPTITANVISEWGTQGSGISMNEYDDDCSYIFPTVSGNTFSDSSDAANMALFFVNDAWSPTYTDNTFSPNNHLCLGFAGNLGFYRTLNRISGVPYLLRDLKVKEGAKLTVPHRTIVLFDDPGSSAYQLTVEGTLSARGAVFTSEKDPVYGIVTGTAHDTDWDGILFQYTGTGSIENSIIRYARTGIECYARQYVEDEVLYDSTVSPRLINNTISNCNDYGIYIRAHYYNSSYRLSDHTYTATASPQVTSNDISVCDIGIYVYADGYYYSSTNTYFNAIARPYISGGSIHHCDTGIDIDQATDGYSESKPAVYYVSLYANGTGINNQTSNTILAYYCGWGDVSGPSHEGNPGGTGDTIIGSVDYSNWVGIPPPEEVAYGTNNHSPKSADPVNTATGNFIHEAEDLVIQGIGLNLVFSRSYNSKSDFAGPLGHGWTHSYLMGIEVDVNGVATVTYGDGHKQEFLPDGDGGFIDPPDCYDTLTDNGDGTFTLTDRDQILHLLDEPNNRLISLSDLNGNTIALGYDGSGDLDSITDTMGRVVNVTCDASHRIVGLSDAIGRTISFEYDINGDLVTATDARLNFEEYTYDGIHQMLTLIDKRGNVKLELVYDWDRVVTTQRDAFSNPTAYVYDTDNRITSITDALDNVYYQHYDTNYRLIREEDPLGNYSEYAYDAKGNRTSVRDKEGHVTTFGYDDKGNVIQNTDPLANSLQAEYNGLNRPVRRVDQNGGETDLTYDANGNLLSAVDPFWRTGFRIW